MIWVVAALVLSHALMWWRVSRNEALQVEACHWARIGIRGVKAHVAQLSISAMRSTDTATNANERIDKLLEDHESSSDRLSA